MKKILLSLSLALAAGCPPPAPPPPPPPPPGDECETDLNFNEESADGVTLGDQVDGFLCPQRDADFYRFTTTTPGSIARIRVFMDTNITAVNPAYSIINGDGSPTGISNSAGATAGEAVDFTGTHRLETAGDYFVRVADLEGFDDRFDITNPYHLVVTVEDDPDPNEVNNDNDNATSLTLGQDIGGQIATTGDEDWFAVPVEVDAQILVLTASAPATLALNLEVSVIDTDGTSLLDAIALDDTTQAGELRVAARGEAGSTYFVRVRDIDGAADIDPALAGYTLNASLIADPDVNEVGGGNNAPDNATALTLGTQTSGALATRADQDFFVVTPGAATPQVLVVTVAFEASAADFQPQIQIITANPEVDDGELTACAAAEPRCPDANNVGDAVPEPIDTICAPGPGGEVCARPLLQRVLNDGQTYVATAPVRRARPYYVQVNELGDDRFQDGTGYTITAELRADPDVGEGDEFLVPNLQFTAYDNGQVLRNQFNRSTPRSIGPPAAPVCTPPPGVDGGPTPGDAGVVDTANCIDMIAVPEPSGQQEPLTVDCNDPLAAPFTINGSGRLAYEGDRDYFTFQLPEEGYWALDMDYQLSAPTGVELSVFTYFGDELNTSFVEGQTTPLQPGTQRCEGGCCDVLGCCAADDQACLDSHVCVDGVCFLDGEDNPAVNTTYPAQDECFFVHVNDNGRPIVVEVTDNGINDFDFDMTYSFSINVSCGCPDVCNVERFTDVFACQGVAAP